MVKDIQTTRTQYFDALYDIQQKQEDLDERLSKIEG